jgi:hypothetical protein
MRNAFMIALAMTLVTVSRPALADETPAPAASDVKTQKAPGGKDNFVVTDKTFIDFTETLIEGQMKAPEGFFLQGRQSQALRQMVRLRSKFRNELGNSKSAVMSLVK